jgi:hypothetical protein
VYLRITRPGQLNDCPRMWRPWGPRRRPGLDRVSRGRLDEDFGVVGFFFLRVLGHLSTLNITWVLYV